MPVRNDVDGMARCPAIAHADLMSEDVDPGTRSVKSLTRRTQRFRELAEQAEHILVEHGVSVPAGVVDRSLNHRNATVAILMGISARQAIWYALDDVPESVADEVMEAIALNETAEDLLAPSPPSSREPRPVEVDPVAVTIVTEVPPEANVVSRFQFSARSGSSAMRAEATLMRSLEHHLEATGSKVSRRVIKIAGEQAPLITDTFDDGAGVLYEVKSNIDRSTIRLAVGQLLDYLRFLPEARGVVATPQPLRGDLLVFVHGCGFGSAHPELGEWEIAWPTS